MKALILQRLADIESRFDVKILFAVESGSRAWGFASKDSDYDVRFVYVHRKEWYLTLIEGRDVIEELDPDGVMDLAGWDIKKALLLMGKGNCAFAEWLNSPIIYANRIAAEIESMLGSFPDAMTPDFKKLDNFFLNILNTFDI